MDEQTAVVESADETPEAPELEPAAVDAGPIALPEDATVIVRALDAELGRVMASIACAQRTYLADVFAKLGVDTAANEVSVDLDTFTYTVRAKNEAPVEPSESDLAEPVESTEPAEPVASVEEA